jgi:hypothetical protein
LFAGAATEFHQVASGTGTSFDGFSPKWGLAFLAFVFFCILFWLTAGLMLWRPARLDSMSGLLVSWRKRLGVARWVAATIVLVAPVWFLQYSPWGVVFSKPYMRLLIWSCSVVVLSFLLSSDSMRALTWTGALVALLLSGAGFVLAVPFGQITSYPFALGWSEGNRLWDYSLLFGLRLYQYSPADPPAAYLEPGRQLVGALPFLLPRVSITGERLWLALIDVVPYLLLGWLVFRPSEKNRNSLWILLGVWGFMFLNQGPIHAPLLVCSILVAIAWGQSLWLAALLVFLAGYFAEISRYTWIFAPAIWAVILEFGSAVADDKRVPSRAWSRAITIGAAGLLGSLLLPRLMEAFHWSLGIRSSASGVSEGGVSVATVASAASKQPLLWYRLLPNATYGSGILIALLIAVGPLIAILVYLALWRWKLNLLQKLCVLLPLTAFLIVGLIISTKIGGGGDLHNLDMFLIGLLFSAALAWRALGAESLASIPESAIWLRGAMLLAIALPALQPLMALRPISFAKDVDWLVVLADVERAKDLGSLPSQVTVATELQKLRTDVSTAEAHGEVLFMDQRQLLTFGYIKDVQLIPEYEKKQMMDEALSGNLNYFEPFYRDLASHRFSLIVSDPLRTPIKDSDYGFGEENNAWVKWVARPVLCYYEEKDTLVNVRVEILVPRQGTNDCSSVQP